MYVQQEMKAKSMSQKWWGGLHPINPNAITPNTITPNATIPSESLPRK